MLTTDSILCVFDCVSLRVVAELVSLCLLKSERSLRTLKWASRISWQWSLLVQ